MDPLLNLNRLNKEDALSISSSLLYSLKGYPQYSVVSELSYLLDYDSFIKMITYYGGMTIRIPSAEEVNDMLKVLLLYQYYEVEGCSWESSLRKIEVPFEESRSYKNKLTQLKKVLKDQEVGGRHYE